MTCEHPYSSEFHNDDNNHMRSHHSQIHYDPITQLPQLLYAWETLSRSVYGSPFHREYLSWEYGNPWHVPFIIFYRSLRSPLDFSTSNFRKQVPRPGAPEASPPVFGHVDDIPRIQDHTGHLNKRGANCPGSGVGGDQMTRISTWDV